MAQVESDRSTTPTMTGPAADPALLATGIGAAESDISNAGILLPVETLSQYRGELETLAAGLRDRGRSFAEIVPQMFVETTEDLQPKARSIIDSLQDLTPLDLPLRPATEAFVNGAVLLAIATLSSVLGSFVVGPLMHILVLRFTAGCLAVALPVYGFRQLQKLQAEGVPNESIRVHLTYLAAAQGLLSGYAISHSYLQSQPLMFIAPLVMSLALPLLVNQGRPVVLAAALSLATIVNLFVGELFQTGTVSYFFLSLLYTAIAGATLQLVYREEPQGRAHVYALLLSGATLAVKTVVFGVFGSSTQ
ncbi:unnamed protein product [Caenorhabditis auriculariae]|uniref:Uncharacterized protein n=1 Tax=Caenorhabditis auriculariae TaxID=2777116 RepID=A0A8S1HH91_9PELO|nr:unnamed protein product [Caenorhabditis auriculariae]